ncbi:YT521-B-like domain-containing protein [Tricladium varicosporioides]|nr:YT521-B-like domain-containing protein [Hymenoscyphus varicosporioides]
MGDTPTDAKPVGDFPGELQDPKQSALQISTGGNTSDFSISVSSQGRSQDNIPLGHYSHMQQYPLQQQPNASHQRPDTFNLGDMAGALPSASIQNFSTVSQERQQVTYSTPGLFYQMPNMTQYGNSQAMSQTMGNVAYNVPYQAQIQGMYATNHMPSPQSIQVGTPVGQYFQGQGYMPQPNQPQYFMQPGQYQQQSQVYSGNSPASPYGTRGGYMGESRPPVQPPREYLAAIPNASPAGRSGSIASSAGQSSVVRGPPRKPRQSGHAIWIGNLPPQTDLMSLVFHVCKETVGLESLFLISKSNCAFANFKDEAACAAAQAKIHDSRFQTVRLVSRLRRTSTATPTGITAPTGPAALASPSSPLPVARSPSPEDNAASRKHVSTIDIVSAWPEVDNEGSAKEKFFIVKSLTVEDLELSVRNGIWATQSHNEEVLNNAYQSTENVYLIFSANKSGEYFGYARMISPINNDPAAAIEFAPKAQSVEDPELPKAISTTATEFAPKGRIIDDSARGTIFWEAERDEEGEDSDDNRSNRSDAESETPPSKAWGKPFKIEWMSTMRLPFYRTRGLRNPWNSNREVKIARDGTELETSIGRKLIGLFHHMPSLAGPQIQGLPPVVMGDYPQIRPFQ